MVSFADCLLILPHESAFGELGSGIHAPSESGHIRDSEDNNSRRPVE